MIAAGIVVIFFARGVFFYGQNYLMSYVGQRVVIDIRSAMFRQLQRLSLSFYDKRKTGTIMSYVTNDVGALQSALIENVIEMVTESVILIGSVAAMVYLHWQLTLFTFATSPIVLKLVKIFGGKIRQSAHRIQESSADIT